MLGKLFGRAPVEPICVCKCKGCKRNFRLGVDAVAVTPQELMGLVGQSVVGASGGIAEKTPDQMDSCDAKSARLWLKTPSVDVIKDSRARKRSRKWQCAKCRTIQAYPWVPETKSGFSKLAAVEEQKKKEMKAKEDDIDPAWLEDERNGKGHSPDELEALRKIAESANTEHLKKRK